jgi:hypothetical protein
MAGVYNPTVTVSPTALISVTTADLTSYEEIQETQGTINYEADALYYQANSIEQINQPIDVDIYNSNGDLAKTSQINPADPNQFQTSKDIDLAESPIIFDGRTRINLNLLPFEKVKLYFTTQQIEPSDFLKGGNDFFSEDFLTTYGFFQDYEDEIKKDNDLAQQTIVNGSKNDEENC